MVSVAWELGLLIASGLGLGIGLGMVVSGFLVEVERADMDKLRKTYPEAFSGPYDQAAGQCFERVLVKDKNY